MAVKVVSLDGIKLEHKLAPHMVVFSHGFGVRRDSRGLFTDIARDLPEDFGYVLFDYYDYDEARSTVKITDFTAQIQRLRAILRWTQAQAGVQTVSVVAHSMGCVVAALARPVHLRHVIFLAPPLSIGERTRQYFTNKLGARHESGQWIVPRSDNTVSLMPDSLFAEFEATDAENAVLTYAAQQPLNLVIAAADEVLDDTDYQSLHGAAGITTETIAEAKHNFNDEARQPLITYINRGLTS